MGFLDTLRSFFRKESADMKEAWSERETRLSADLDRKERDLTASPTERFEMLQDEVEATDDPLAAIRARVDQAAATAAADADLAEPGASSGEGPGEEPGAGTATSDKL